MNIREKILIVEDEKSIAHFISTILNSNDYETLLARSGSEAKTMISSHCPDLVILDLGLPDMDGIDVLRELRSWSNLPVVVVSARSHEHDKVQALDLGADDYLTKPFHFIELQDRLRALLRGFNAQTASVVVGDWACSSRTPASSRIRTQGRVARVCASSQMGADPRVRPWAGHRRRSRTTVPPLRPGPMTAPRTKGTGSASRSPVTWRTGMVARSRWSPRPRPAPRCCSLSRWPDGASPVCYSL